jgi:hypothetical protein
VRGFSIVDPNNPGIYASAIKDDNLPPGQTALAKTFAYPGENTEYGNQDLRLDIATEKADGLRSQILVFPEFFTATAFNNEYTIQNDDDASAAAGHESEHARKFNEYRNDQVFINFANAPLLGYETSLYGRYSELNAYVFQMQYMRDNNLVNSIGFTETSKFFLYDHYRFMASVYNSPHNDGEMADTQWTLVNLFDDTLNNFNFTLDNVTSPVLKVENGTPFIFDYETRSYQALPAELSSRIASAPSMFAGSFAGHVTETFNVDQAKLDALLYLGDPFIAMQTAVAIDLPKLSLMLDKRDSFYR